MGSVRMRLGKVGFSQRVLKGWGIMAGAEGRWMEKCVRAEGWCLIGVGEGL